MNNKLLNTIANAIDNKDEIKKRVESGKSALRELQTCVENCQNRFGGKSELATEDDIRIVNLCEKWEKVLSHGLKTNLSNSTLQNLVSAGLSFTFNIVNIGNSLWSYSCLHLTKHEKERFKILANINTPLGYFRAFLRASLNERSLERYLQSWISHGLLVEYYDEGAFLRSPESNLLPGLAAALSSVLFALSIDRTELNESQHSNHVNKTELVIPLPTPIKTSTNTKRKPVRQVISFDKVESKNEIKTRKSLETVENCSEISCNSAPATCLNSPDAKVVVKSVSVSEPTSSDCKSGIRHFFPDSVKAIESPLQILSKLSESAKEIFSSSQSSIEKSNVVKDDISDLSANCIKIYDSDSEEAAGSIDGSTSCLELCFTEDEHDQKSLDSVLESREREFMNLQLKYNQFEATSKDKIHKLEKVVLDLNKENDRLKEQLRNYMSAVEMGIALKNSNSGHDDEINHYERKLVQVAEMHAELMEFNQHLQKRLQDLENSGVEILEMPESNVKAYIPSAFLVGKKTHTYHVYQIFLKIGQEEWNVYHRYAKFYELHTQLKKCHPDIANYKFPPKKTLRKRDARLVEQRRAALQAYLRHVLLVLPELRNCTSRAQLVTLLPFFGISTTAKENGVNTLTRQQSNDSVATFNAL